MVTWVPRSTPHNLQRFLIRFDGSFSRHGAGIGVTFGYLHSPTPFASFALPTRTKDA